MSESAQLAPAASGIRVDEPSGELIASLSLFGGLEPEICNYFASRLERVDLVAGEVVYEEGDPAHELFIVATGQLKVFKPSRSADVALAELGDGEFFGDMSFIDMQPRSATVRASQATTVWRLPYGTLREAYLRDLKCYTLVVMNIAREMSRRLRRADTYRQLMRGESPVQRPSRSTTAGVIGRIGLRGLTLHSGS